MDITLDERLSALAQISQRKFIDVLNSISGKKDLIIEQKLMKPLDSFIGATILKRHGVDKIFKFEQGLKPMNTQRIFITSCDLLSLKPVLDQIQSEISDAQGLAFHMLVTPFVPAVIHSLIEDEGLANLVSVRPLSWELIPIDGNILSLETPIFPELYYYKDTTLLSALARRLWSLQIVVGWPKLTLTFGKYSEQLLKMIDVMREPLRSSIPELEIGGLIIMDRSYDFVSTLLTPVSYLGLLSEVIPINVSTAMVENNQIKLDSTRDRVYEDIRDIHFSDVFTKLQAKAKSLKTEQEATKNMPLEEMGIYVATQLQKTTEVKKQLASHISVCETIISVLGSEFESLQSIEKSILDCTRRKECLEYIEKHIDTHPLRSIRLLCLLSIASDGITHSEIQTIQKSYFNVHGYNNCLLFLKLETAGLLRYRKENLLKKLPTWNSEWFTSAQKMKLLPNQNKKNEMKSSCPSYVFSRAYIPAIAQFLSIALAQSTDPKSFDELINLPGCKANAPKAFIQPKTVIVCVIGGLTYGEISACRLVEKSTGVRIVLVSDCLVTGDKFIKGIQVA